MISVERAFSLDTSKRLAYHFSVVQVEFSEGLPRMKRIDKHPILNFKMGKAVRFSFDGRELEGFEGEPIASALHANGVQVYSRSAKHDRPRGFFCAIGRCSACFVVVDGVPNTRACITPLCGGMKVETQAGRGKLPV
jgi:hypothetical protein